MNDVYREKTAKLLLSAFRNIWCDRESDEEPYFNCSVCEFEDGENCVLKQFIKAEKYETKYPQGMIKGGDAEVTVIPEGTGLMQQSPNDGADLISREDAVNVVKRMLGNVGESVAIELNCLTGYVPTADRPHGEWVNNEHDIPVCSKCGYFTPYDRAIDDYEYGNYCPNCGAKMGGEE